MLRLNTEGQLTSGEWCLKTDKKVGTSVSWCEMGRTYGPWEYRVDRQEMYHTENRRCLAIHPDTGKLIPMPPPC